MKKTIPCKILLFVGVIPFIVPLALGIYRIQIEAWTMIDWLVLYSFIYWPTYAIGMALIIFSAVMLARTKKSKR